MPPRPGDMKDDKRRIRRRKPAGDPQQIGVIRVFSNPGPDAQDRVRRLVSLMIKHATSDNRNDLEKESPSDQSQAGDRDETGEPDV